MSIHFIAADLDGTLLDSKKRLPKDFFALVQTLRAQGVRFAPASGRQYYSMRKVFAPIAEDLMYISENGAMVCDGSRVVSFTAMQMHDVCRIVERARMIEGVTPILSTQQGAVYEHSQDAVLLENLELYFTQRTAVSDVLTIARTVPVCKVALFCKDRAEQVALPAMQEMRNDIQLALASADWLDCMRLGMNKGCAIEVLCNRLHITHAQCMAFGDYLNDLEMLQAVGHSYAMANAHPLLREAAKHICPSNDEDGVCRTIRAVLQLDK